MDINQCKEKAKYIRDKIIEKVSQDGGYLSSNLSCVDIIVALNQYLGASDRLFFCSDDLKLGYELLSNKNGEVLSLSQVLAQCITRDLNHENYKICVVLNSSYLRSSKDLEALDEISKLNSQLLIIFNDDTMISQGIGVVDKLISNLRNTKTYNNIKDKAKEVLKPHRNGSKVIEEIHNLKSDIRKTILDEGIFGTYDLDYQGPIDGNNFSEIIRALDIAKSKTYPTVIHCLSLSGKGYRYGESCTTDYWYKVEPFNIETGKSLVSEIEGYKYGKNIISDEIAKLMIERKDIITLSNDRLMFDGVSKIFSHFQERSIRTYNITNEMEMAITFAKEGKIPFITIKASELNELYSYFKDINNLNMIIGLNNDLNDLLYLENSKDINIVEIVDNISIDDILSKAISNNKPTVFVYKNKIYKIN